MCVIVYSIELPTSYFVKRTSTQYNIIILQHLLYIMVIVIWILNTIDNNTITSNNDNNTFTNNYHYNNNKCTPRWRRRGATSPCRPSCRCRTGMLSVIGHNRRFYASTTINNCFYALAFFLLLPPKPNLLLRVLAGKTQSVCMHESTIACTEVCKHSRYTWCVWDICQPLPVVSQTGSVGAHLSKRRPLG